MIYTYRHRSNRLRDIRIAAQEGFDGVECDVYLTKDGAFVGHDPSPTDLMLDEYVEEARDNTLRIAFDVKSNGLLDHLIEVVRDPEDFVFDLPGEEVFDYGQSLVRYFSRVSEFDFQTWVKNAAGIMVDSFIAEPGTLLKHLPKTKNIGIIDGPLHGKQGFTLKALEDLGDFKTIHFITKTAFRYTNATLGDFRGH